MSETEEKLSEALARVAELEAALRPFAVARIVAGQWPSPGYGGCPWHEEAPRHVSSVDWANAADAYAGKPGEFSLHGWKPGARRYAEAQAISLLNDVRADHIRSGK